MLDARAADKGRSARNHLLAIGATVGIGRQRVDEVLDLVGLTDVAGKNAGGFSLGMGQRLGIATALLGDPNTVMLDEPVNGLDPDGILWIRSLLKDLASEGRTVFVSSHLMSEMELTADHLVVIGKGRILADMPMVEFISRSSQRHVHVISPDANQLRALVGEDRVKASSTDPNELEVRGVDAREVGELAARHNLVLHELVGVDASLEEAFMELTRNSVAFHSGTTKEGASQ
jgi:ABC-2 type transport system ATP-binding protein